jgi:hypothetical protein
MHSKAIGQIQRKSGDSHFLLGLMKINDCFLSFGTFHLNNGENTRFWEDKWIGNRPLKEQYPTLYRITRHIHKLLALVFSTIPLNISFRRSLSRDNLASWDNMVARISHVTLNNRSDVFRWGLNQYRILL